MAWPVLSGVAVIALGVLGLWWHNQQAIIDLQLTTHKMMLPRQIRGARRTYTRGLIREATGPRRIRAIAVTVGVVAGLTGAGALALWADARGWVVLPTPVTVDLSDPTPWIAGLALVAVLATLAWAGLTAWLTHWLTGVQRAADAAHAGGPSDLYWTPADRLTRDLRLRLTGLALAAVLATGVGLSIGGDPTLSDDVWSPRMGTEPTTVQPASGRTSSSATRSASSAATTASADAASDQSTQTPTEMTPAAAALTRATPASTKHLARGDAATLAQMAYWALTDGTLPAQMARVTREYYCHQYGRDLTVYWTTAGDAGEVFTFYTWTKGDQVAFYATGHVRVATTADALATFAIATSTDGLTHTPTATPLARLDLRRLVTAYHATTSGKAGAPFRAVKAALMWYAPRPGL
ncbi:hypothetical protein [Lacticaseibacillus absianus]|uniref:hypothetical protein n=1 Tax=Lacticaseibacillus absianus TaxID=2729623 RepID=UPI0015CEC246|nr:hypothetical protein [Lacticaseibacillus absianus]